MTDLPPRVDPTGAHADGDGNSVRDGGDESEPANHRRNETIDLTSKEGIIDLLSFDSIWNDDDETVPEHLAWFRDILTDIFDSHFVGCMQFRWTATDRCQLSIGGAILPAALLTDLVSNPVYDTELVSMVTHRRDDAFQLSYATITKLDQKHCDGTGDKDALCLHCICDDDCDCEYPADSETTTAEFADPVLDSWTRSPSLSMDPVVTVATIDFDPAFISPDEIFFSSERTRNQYQNRN